MCFVLKSPPFGSSTGENCLFIEAPADGKGPSGVWLSRWVCLKKGMPLMPGFLHLNLLPFHWGLSVCLPLSSRWALKHFEKVSRQPADQVDDARSKKARLKTCSAGFPSLKMITISRSWNCHVGILLLAYEQLSQCGTACFFKIHQQRKGN